MRDAVDVRAGGHVDRGVEHEAVAGGVQNDAAGAEDRPGRHDLARRGGDHEGVDLIQLDEPDFHFRPDQAKKWGVRALDVAFANVLTKKIVHCCYGYAMVGSKKADSTYKGILEVIAQSKADQISIEYEQPGHTPEILENLGEKIIVLGVLNLGLKEIESVEHITHRIYEALEVVPLDRLHLAPDCGMWFVPRDIAFGKIQNMVLAARQVRRKFGI